MQIGVSLIIRITVNFNNGSVSKCVSGNWLEKETCPQPHDESHIHPKAGMYTHMLFSRTNDSQERLHSFVNLQRQNCSHEVKVTHANKIPVKLK